MDNVLINSREAFSKDHPELPVQLNGREWGVIEAGTVGPVLFLLPGTLGRADILWQQISALESRARIFSFSYPDSGLIEDWVADIASFLVAKEITSVTMLGSSLGGYLAQLIADAHPSSIDSLIAANTLNSVALLQNIPPYSLDIDATPIDDLRAGFVEKMQGSLKQAPESRELVELLLEEVRGRIPEGEMRMRLKALQQAPELAVGAIGEYPCYTVESLDDQLIPQPISQMVRQRLNPARAYRFKIGSHFPYVTRPKAYLAILEEVLGLEITGDPWPQGEISEQ
ncbi:MAG: alpha/beta hydrolase [Rhizobiaceae bacterium]